MDSITMSENGEPVLSNKELLRRLYEDMQVVRPAVEAMHAERLPTRLRAVEERHIAEDAAAKGRGVVLTAGKAAALTLVAVGEGIVAILVMLVK